MPLCSRRVFCSPGDRDVGIPELLALLRSSFPNYILQPQALFSEAGGLSSTNLSGGRVGFSQNTAG